MNILGFKKLLTFSLTTLVILTSIPFIPNYSLGQERLPQDNFSTDYFEEIDPASLKNIYENDRLNFTIKYPEDWSFFEDEHQYTNYITFLSPTLNNSKLASRIPDDEAKVEVYILKNESSKDISTWVEEFIENDPFKPEVKNSWDLNIGGEDSILHILNAAGMDYYVAYVPYRDKVLLFLGPTVSNRYVLTFLRMLKSFNEQKSLSLRSLFSIPTARAGYLSSPLSNLQIFSWFDHYNPNYTTNSQVATYDGRVFTGLVNVANCTGFVNCYDGHDGYDFVAASGTPIYASGDGTVTIGGTPSSIGGYWLRIWHATEGYSTYYGHLSSYAVTSGSVVRGQLIANSGATGVNVSEHLHFSTYNSQNGWYYPPGAAIDPYGWTGTTTSSGTSCGSSGCAPWTGTTTDPWPYNQGFLWTTNPPSLAGPATPSVSQNFTPVSGTISQNTTWIAANNPYVIEGSATVNSGVTLTIQPGVVVKFNPQTSGSQGVLTVNGALNAQGTATNKIYFTSIKDDSVGGDTNGDGNATSPAPGNYAGLKFNSGSTGTISNTVLRYGGANACTSYICVGGIKNLGGQVNITNSQITNNSPGIYAKYGGSLIVDSSTISNNNGSGIVIGSVPPVNLAITNNTISNNIGHGVSLSISIYTTTTLTLTNNAFSNNLDGDGYFNGPINFVNSGNSTSGTTANGFEISGTPPTNQIWNPGVPFVIRYGISIPSGKTLTIQPGTIVKLGYETYTLSATQIEVYGTLIAQGTTANKIYFTSLKDDSVGGDTNGDGNATSPAPLDFRGIKFSGSTGVFDNTVLRYGGDEACGSGSCYGVIKSFGSQVSILNTRINSNDYGVSQYSGTTTISQSSIYDNTSYGIDNSSSNITTAQNNWWGTPTGPYHPTLNPSGTGNQVSNNVSFSPWLNYDPTDPPQPCSLTGC